MEERQRPLSNGSRTWRIALTLLGIALLVNGSLRMSDDVWPFGPLSQYAFSPSRHAAIVITRVEGSFVDGRRMDLPLQVESTGIGRAEIEARISQIKADPALLATVVDGWTRRHPGQTPLRRVWLVQDETRLVNGRKGATRLVELATWRVPT